MSYSGFLEDPVNDPRTAPERKGLYDPANEHDACGVGFVANIKGKKAHAIVEQGLTILRNLTHRGAVGATTQALGDGAGILIQIPDRFFREEMATQGVQLPPAGQYGVGMVFLPQRARLAPRLRVRDRARDQGRRPDPARLARRAGATTADLAESAKRIEPVIRQVFIGRGKGVTVTDALERKLYIIRKSSGHAIQALKLAHGKEFYVPSMSARTIVYKGMLLAHQVGDLLPGPAGSARRVRARARAPALLDQHLPDAGTSRTRSA